MTDRELLEKLLKAADRAEETIVRIKYLLSDIEHHLGRIERRARRYAASQ